jgi:hypothetical protein
MSKQRTILASAGAMIAAAGFAIAAAPSSQAASPATGSCEGYYYLCLIGPPPNDTFLGNYSCTPRTLQYGGFIGTVVNYCTTRVWLHQYNNGTGWTLCISPTYDEDTNYNGAIANFQITSNKNNC